MLLNTEVIVHGQRNIVHAHADGAVATINMYTSNICTSNMYTNKSPSPPITHTVNIVACTCTR